MTMARHNLEERKKILKRMRENYLSINKCTKRLDNEIRSIEYNQLKNNKSLESYQL